MRLVLWGYYGYNYGDDIMMEVILKFLNEKNVKVELVDLFEGRLNEKYGEKYENVRVIPFYKLNKVEKLKKLMNFSKASLNLWGGGTIFTDVDGDGNYKWFSLIKLFGGKIGYVGIGIGTMKKKERLKKTKKMLKASSLTIFRDASSLRIANTIAKNSKYKIVEDIAYIYFKDLLDNNNYEICNKDYVLITWRNLKRYLDFKDEMKLMDDIIQETEKIMKERNVPKVILSALDTRHDIESCRYLYVKLRNRNIPVEFDIDSNVENISKLITEAYFHFSGRLHGSIASEIFGTPTYSLSYSPKMEYFYESINSKNFMNIYEQEIDSEIINKVIINNNINLDLNKKVTDAYLNFKYLFEFLN
ncbi:polysaccharide pyruvyl transferase family protein [Bacillus sp. ISL-46]|uniref:polysaccharide pyruvyl transferase family protein n=1 Tax=Bacillus sp. ISL-46 TaxID=2819129 RepID=UPI001BEC8B1D|nr:polysaccharide pyruvyl transferase family protein [Bacillus sp. ISL-46]MBT2724010.1 polysaccharide pyruvyl transferase family protein [Bacillus sp. ISL-46]